MISSFIAVSASINRARYNISEASLPMMVTLFLVRLEVLAVTPNYSGFGDD